MHLLRYKEWTVFAKLPGYKAEEIELYFRRKLPSIYTPDLFVIYDISYDHEEHEEDNIFYKGPLLPETKDLAIKIKKEDCILEGELYF